MSDEISDDIMEITFQRLQLCTQKHLPWGALRQATELSTYVDHQLEGMVLQLYASVAERENERVSCRWPADWWQAVKARFAPAWFLERYPVEFERRTLVASYIYPNVEFPVEKLLHFPIARIEHD